MPLIAKLGIQVRRMLTSWNPLLWEGLLYADWLGTYSVGSVPCDESLGAKRDEEVSLPGLVGRGPVAVVKEEEEQQQEEEEGGRMDVAPRLATQYEAVDEEAAGPLRAYVYGHTVENIRFGGSWLAVCTRADDHMEAENGWEEEEEGEMLLAGQEEEGNVVAEVEAEADTDGHILVADKTDHGAGRSCMGLEGLHKGSWHAGMVDEAAMMVAVAHHRGWAENRPEAEDIW
jgi:hypothetical protein